MSMYNHPSLILKDGDESTNGSCVPSDEFIHTGKGVAGFYRNAKAARAEAIVLKNNAANGPKRPPFSAIKYKLDQEGKCMLELENVVGVFYD